MNQENVFFLEDVNELIPGLKAFPEDVFTPEQPWLVNHFLPLLSIDLGILRPDLAGQIVHMLNPIEPIYGYIGYGTEVYHNEYTAPNWLAFKLTPDNRFLFLGNENYFLNTPANAEKLTGDDVEEHLQEMHTSYIEAKQAHAQGKGLRHPYLDELGGEFWCGNWASDPPPSAFVFNCDDSSYEDDQPNDGISITHQGNPFFPVASVSGYNWCAHGADAILMFYEPVSRIVLYTFEWT